jgi:hypothetical protein
MVARAKHVDLDRYAGYLARQRSVTSSQIHGPVGIDQDRVIAPGADRHQIGSRVDPGIIRTIGIIVESRPEDRGRGAGSQETGDHQGKQAVTFRRCFVIHFIGPAMSRTFETCAGAIRTVQFEPYTVSIEGHSGLEAANGR